MSVASRRLARTPYGGHQFASTYVGYDVSNNGIDWSKVHWDVGQTSLIVDATNQPVTSGNKSDWEQFATPNDARLEYLSRFGHASYFMKFYDFGNGITTALNMYKNNGGSARWPVLCHKKWNVADPTQDIADFNAAMTYFGGLNRPWVVVYFQEPQYYGHTGVPEAQPAYYLDVYAGMNAARAVHPSGHLCYMMKNLFWPNRSPIDPAYLWPGYDGGQKFERLFIGADIYSDERKTAPMNGPELAGMLVEWAQATGLQPVVPEFAIAQNYGVVKGNNTDVIGTMMTGAEHTAAIKEIVDYCRAHRFGWINYWNPNSDCSVTNTGYARWELQTAETIAYWSGQMGFNPAL